MGGTASPFCPQPNGSRAPASGDRLGVPGMAESVRRYFQAGIATSTQRLYNSGIRRFCSFCERFGISTPFPVTEFPVAYLADEGLSPQTVKSYVAAVRNAQLSLGLPDPRETSAFPILKRVQAGVSHLRLQQGDSAHVRLPITAELLSRIRVALQTSSDPERPLFWVICCTAFFGFFRLGELLLSSVSEFNDSLHLGWGDVAFDHPSLPTMATIHLKRSKTDQSGRGCHIIVGRTGTELCPISAVMSYVSTRGDRPGPFFINSASVPMTKARFILRLRAVLTEIGVPRTCMLDTVSGFGWLLRPPRPGWRTRQFRPWAPSNVTLLARSMGLVLTSPKTSWPAVDGCADRAKATSESRDQR